jgi:SAM-dependent methyltransferase
MAATNDASNADRHQKWYDPDIEDVNPQIRHLLEAYSKVPSSDVVKHVNEIVCLHYFITELVNPNDNQRARGFAANPYPCIGHYRFLNLTLLTHPLYESILARLKSNPSATYLDLGCCFGQDLRQIVLDGVPSSQLIGLDIEGPLMDLGYELFLDHNTLESKFAVADIFQGESQGEPWAGLMARGVDVIHCSAVFHLFTLAEQFEAANSVAKLVKNGGIIVGRQSGSVKPSEVSAIKPGSTSFRHDVRTLAELWEKVGAATGTKWKVEGSLDEVGVQNKGNNAVEDENSRRLLFTITREE